MTGYTGEIAKLLTEYREKGQREAAAFRPPSDAVRPDEYEAALRSTAEKHISEAQRRFEVVLAESQRTLAEVRQKIIELRAKTDQLLSDRSLIGSVQSELAGERKSLVTAAEERIRAQVDWRAFREEQKLKRDANYPESLVWHLGLVIAFAFGETLANTMFFMGNANGILDGFTIALGVSIINIGTALVLGIGFRYKNLTSVDKKIGGWLCALLFVLLTLYCNALFATFRAEYEQLQQVNPNTREAFKAAMLEARRIYFLDIDLGDFTSFVLFGFGVLLSVLAFWKGYTIDDACPGYSRRDKRLKAAHRTERDLQESVRTRLKDFLHAKRVEMHATISEPSKIVTRAAGAAAQINSSRASLQAESHSVQMDYKLVLEAYRGANVAVRGTDPPAYFNEIPNVAGRVSFDSSLPVLEELEQAQTDVNSLRDQNDPRLSSKLNELQDDTARVMKDLLSEFLAEVEEEAKESIDRSTVTIDGPHPR